MSRVLVYGFVVICLFSLRAESTDLCDDDGHRSIPNEGFRYVYFKISSDDTPLHDSRLLQSWYSVGNTKMPESPPDLFSCGTKFPIWLNGTHPTGMKEFECPNCACRAGLTNNCSKRYDIKIKYCPKPKGSYLYYLKPTADITEGYCFGVGINGSATKYVPPKPKVLVSLHTIRIQGLPISRVRFRCDFTESTANNLLYRVSWWREDEQWYTTPYATDSTKDEFLLTEELFQQKGFRMGEKISCTVRAFVVEDGPPGKPSTRSDAEFIGIKILTPLLSFQNGENSTPKRTIKLKPTVPVGCSATEKCSIWLTAYTNISDGYKNCSGLVLETTSCGTSINSKKYDKELHILIKTEETGIYQTKDDIYYIHLRTGETAENELWKNYQLPPIKVLITPKPTQTYQGKKCFAHPDPHMQMFDGRSYENHRAGVFTLYQHDKFDAEIQVKHEHCRSHHGIAIMCPCGVAVRAGPDTYVITLCDREFKFEYKTCGDHALIAKCIDSTHYKITLPYGTYVYVTVSGNVLLVDVIPSIYDDNSASMGLCGRLDGDCTNDYHYKDGSNIKGNCQKDLSYKYDEQPEAFITAWQVTQPIKNMFNPEFNTTNPVAISWSHKACACEKSESTGGAFIKNYVKCQTNTVSSCTESRGKVIKGQCIDPTRHRRSLRGNHVVPTVFIPRSISLDREKRAPVGNKTWTEADANDFCDKYMKRSPIFDLCGKVPNANTDFSVGTCVSDIMLTGGTEWAAMSVEGMRVSCLSELERNTTLRETNKTSGQPSIAQIIEEKACPNNCSDSGDCVKGKCHCNPGFGSSDCSLDMSKVPTLSGLLDHGLCDEQQLKCDHAYVFGHIFTDVGNLTCKLKEFSNNNIFNHDARIPSAVVCTIDQISQLIERWGTKQYNWISMEGSRSPRSTHYLPGEFETLVEIVCPLHLVRPKRSIKSTGEQREFVFGYSISVSNDGNHFQNDGHDLFVYDSECQLVTNISGQMHFKLKEGYCFLDQKCVLDGKRSVSNNCSLCYSQTSPTTWSSDTNSPGCASISPQKNNTNSKNPKYLWIIGVVGGVLIGAVVASIVFVKLTKKRAQKVGDSTLLRTSNVAVTGHTTEDTRP